MYICDFKESNIKGGYIKMKKCFKKAVSGILATAMLFSSMAFTSVSAYAAGFSVAGGWNESLYAEWQDSDPDNVAVQVGYKLSTDTDYTYLAGDDLTYLVRKASTSGFGRVDIPGLKAGRYDLIVKASNGAEYTRNGIKVYENDRSGYAHWNRSSSETAYTGVGAYKDDGTPKDNAIIIYVTDENKDTVTIPGYEDKVYSYTPSSSDPYTRTTEGIGNILNNNMKFIQEVTITDNHPLIIRFVGKVNVPKNLTPYNVKDPILGGAKGDNGNLAITKYGRNITLEGVGNDALIDGWGFTFSHSPTCPAEAGKSYEVSNLTFKNYTEDAIGFQGDDGLTCPIQRVWVHNNTFYPGYCANPAESDKAEGDGSCDFKRGQYYTMAYNHFVDCHKTNLLGSGGTDDQWYMTLHHNWYQNVASRQPLAANGNVHIYSTYFQNASSVTVDLRYNNASLLENNYYDGCKGYLNTRNNTCIVKSFNEFVSSDSKMGSKTSGKVTTVSSRSQSGISNNGYNFPNGDAMTDFDMNPSHFYYDSANKVSDVSVMTPASEVPAYVMAHAGVMQPYEETESGDIIITVKSGSTPITGAKLTASGLTFTEQGNGVYVAAAAIGATYSIVVSKEGYSNVTINTTAINENGGTFTATADMVADTDGYAVVKLVGGSNGAPVKGASVVLNDGTVLVDQNDGTYKSAKQLALGEYTATITNTGDYIAPSSPKTVIVKTTDEETVITLDKYTGTVNVTLTAAAGETEVLDPSIATVKVGETVLTYNNGVFTGLVEINTPYTVSVKVPGWNTDSVTPAEITANKNNAVSATAVLSYKGALATWNFTDGTNTLNASVTANEWSSASSNPQTFEGLTLTKAVKMESSTSITFNAEMDGTLSVVMYSTASDPSIVIDGTEYNVEPSGVTEIPVTAGSHTVKKGTSSTYLYLMQFAGGGSVTPSESTTETTTKIVETTTEATTKATETTTKTTETTTEESSETTTETPVSGVKVAVGTASAKVGDTITVPVKLTGLTSLANYDICVSYDSTILNAVKVENGDIVNSSNAEIVDNLANAGEVNVAAINPDDTINADGTVLLNITFNALNTGTSNLTLRVDELFAGNLAAVEYTTDNGSVTVAENGGEVVQGSGDVNKDGKVNAEDAAIVLKIVSGIITDTSAYDMTAADCDGKAGITVLDAIWILNHQSGEETTATTEATTEATTAATTEAATEATTTAPAGEGLAAGTYTLNKVNVVTDGIQGIDASNIYGSDSGAVKVREATYLGVVPSVSGTLTITWSSNAPKLSLVNNDGTLTDVGTAAASPASFNVEAGKTYRIYGTKAGGNSNLTELTLTDNGSVTPTETTTEVTTIATTEATTVTTTETTTKAADTTTEATTETPVVGSVYTHNFGTDGNNSTFYTIAGSLSTSKGDVTYNGLTISQCLKMESATNVSFTASKSGTLTLVFGGTTAAAGKTVKIDGTEYIADSNGIVTADLSAGAHTVTKGDAINLFYMSYSEGGSSVDPDETTTKNSDATTETTTANIDGAINIASGDSASLATALKNATAGTVINLAAGNYKMSAATSMSKSGTASNPITITCASGRATLDYDGTSGQAIKVSGNYMNFSNLTVKNGGDNGMYVTGGHINIENCIFQGNGDTGLQISSGGNNVLVKNCTSFDNLQAENADGFAAKLGVGENVVFDGCISYCNSDDGWDLYSKSGDQQNKYPITIRNCVAFNNGFLTDGTVEPKGDRNGFKLGGMGYSTKNVVENCIAFGNGACGFTDNNNPGLAQLKNCTGYMNAQTDVKKHNFSVYRATEDLNMTNCLSYILNTDPNGGMDRFNGTSSDVAYNANATVINSVLGYANKYYKVANSKITSSEAISTNGTEVTVSDSDFVTLSLPYTDLQNVHEEMRNADGSIKLNGFLQPKAGSVIEGIGAQFN